MIVTRSHHGPHMGRVFTEPFLLKPESLSLIRPAHAKHAC
jgi:hypothetical protein